MNSKKVPPQLQGQRTEELAVSFPGEHNASEGSGARGSAPYSAQISLKELWAVLVRRRRAFGGIVGGCLLLCLVYWLVAPNQYESSARILVRTSPSSPLGMDGQSSSSDLSIAASDLSVSASALQQETLASILRSERLAWKVITALKLYQDPAFMGSLARQFPGFNPGAPSAAAQDYLLKRFLWRLHVQTLPQTLLVEIRFRSRDAGLSARVVAALLRACTEQESESRLDSSLQASGWLEGQLRRIKEQLDQEQQKLSEFQRVHGILSTPESTADSRAIEAQHSPVMLEVDELGRQLVAASTERILREAEYRAASRGDPELVMASTPRLLAESSVLATALLHQIHAKRSDLEQEAAQLKTEHGPNFPRVVEIESQLLDLKRQKQVEDAKLVERFRTAWQTAREREEMVRQTLDERVAEGMKQNRAAAEYAAMRQETESSRALYLRIRGKVEENALAAGAILPGFSVVDPPRIPANPVAPNLVLDLSLALFVGFWLAWGGVFLLETFGVAARVTTLLAFLFLGAASAAGAQAPTPSTSGVPTGVARIPLSRETKSAPNPRDSPAVWQSTATETASSPVWQTSADLPLPAPISAGDFLEISEFRTPEFRSQVHVSPTGTVTLPLIGEIGLLGVDEQAAARRIEGALVAKGMLLHPHVVVLVTAYVGQDVSVLGEVVRPGVYPYTVHHRLLDLISAASGVSANAGRLVHVFHRDDPKTTHAVVLDPGGSDSGEEHNPELLPGDTVQVSRAGLVYVIGDVVRPGGFSVDPSQGITVAQALSLAWGPSQNANSRRAILIREQKGGRALIALDLKRILHGQDPDQPLYDRDILFVPDSTAKSLFNRTIESAIQSLVGVSIYSGLVYSQRY